MFRGVAVSIYHDPLAPAPVSPSSRRSRTAHLALAGVVVVVLAVTSALVVQAGAEAVLGQCAPTWLVGTDPQLCLNASIYGRTLSVTGSTSLPDGAIVQVWATDDGTGYDQRWTTDTLSLTVSNGAFGRSFDLSDWGAGTVTVYAQFEVSSDQPESVVSRYGAKGERLNGPDVKPDFSQGDPPPLAVQSSTDVDLPAG